MSSRKSILLLVAGLIAILVVFAVRSVLTQPNGTIAAPKAEVRSTEILAAAHDLPTGTILKEMDMKWIPWSAEATQNGKFYVKDKAQMSELVGAVLREGLHSDEPFMTGRVVQPNEQGFLAAILTPGKRAMAVTLTPSSGVAGFIFPGDHVDVILTHGFSRKDNNDYTDRSVSETVISDARVLALDQRSDNQSNDPKVAQLATLEVSAKQAEKLALAASMASPNGNRNATLSLVLRSLALEDGTAAVSSQADGGTTWDSDISAAYPTVNGEDGLLHRVQIMRGKEKTESSFERRRAP